MRQTSDCKTYLGGHTWCCDT